MKNKLLVVIVFVLLLCMCGCSDNTSILTDYNYVENVSENDFVENTAEDETFANWMLEEVNGYYNYEIRDNNGNILLSVHEATAEPYIAYTDAGTIEVTVQIGTGRESTVTQYCDVENGVVSEEFYYVVSKYNEKVVYQDYRGDEEYYVVIQDIFDKNAFYKEFKLESPLDCGDVVMDAVLSQDGKALTVTYISGDAYDNSTECETIFYIE